MELNTTRLKIRQLSLLDLDSIHELHSLPETDQYNTMGIPKNIGITKQLISEWLDSQNELPRKRYVFFIENNDIEFIGLIGITMGKLAYKNAEIWYKLHPNHWNQGFATEVVNEILRFCFIELKLHRIEAGSATANIASIKVLEKCGFKREGMKRKILPIRGDWLDNYEYAILDEDFNKFP